jgi:hypothetical protein
MSIQHPIATGLSLIAVGIFMLLSRAHGQTLPEPSWEVKKAALMDAYHANGDRMSGWGMYERDTPRVIETKPATPVAKADNKNEVDEQADLNMEDLKKFSRRANYKTDICARHGKHKVMTHGGSSWRCK